MFGTSNRDIRHYHLNLGLHCKLLDEIGRIYYDVLKPTGEDNKQEWIVLTDKEDTEPFFAFQSSYRTNKFLSGDNGPLLYLGSGGWNVQRFY